MLLKQKLEYHYKAFDKTKLEPDPLQFPHKFTDEKDIERWPLLHPYLHTEMLSRSIIL